MRYFYIDESGLTRLDKIQVSSPYFILGGVVVCDDDYGQVCRKLVDFKREHFPELDPTSFSMHASELFNARGVFSSMPLDRLKSVGTKFFHLINALPVTLIVTAISKPKLVARYSSATVQDPYLLAWLYCCDRYNKLLEEAGEENGRTVLESRGPGLDKLYRQKLDSFLAMGTKYGGACSRVGRPEFSGPSEKPPLELADFACYAIHKRYNKSEREYFDIVAARFRNHKGKVDGYGLVEFPK